MCLIDVNVWTVFQYQVSIWLFKKNHAGEEWFQWLLFLKQNWIIKPVGCDFKAVKVDNSFHKSDSASFNTEINKLFSYVMKKEKKK